LLIFQAIEAQVIDSALQLVLLFLKLLIADNFGQKLKYI
jgi:hypothetical protein